MNNIKLLSSKSIGTAPGGNPISINSYEYSNGVSGPTLYLQGGVHGGEVTIWILKQLINKLQSHEIKGNILFVPIANPIAWNQRTYFSTNGKFDFYMGKDWNRSYPGSADGTLSQRISSVGFDLASNSDFAMDLHTCRDSVPFTIYSRKFEHLTKAFGLELNYQDENIDGKTDGSLGDELTRIDIANFTLECGSHDSYDESNTDELSNRIMMLMHELGMLIEPEVKEASQPKKFTHLNTYLSPDGGFIDHKVASGASVSDGQVMGELNYTDLTKENTLITARSNELILKISPTHIYYPGDHVYQTISEDDLSPI